MLHAGGSGMLTRAGLPGAMMNRIAAVIMGCFTLIGAASASGPPPMTIGHLKDACSTSDQAAQAVCSAYIVGTVQGIQIGLSLAAHRAASRPCIPLGTSG